MTIRIAPSTSLVATFTLTFHRRPTNRWNTLSVFHLPPGYEICQLPPLQVPDGSMYVHYSTLLQTIGERIAAAIHGPHRSSLRQPDRWLAMRNHLCIGGSLDGKWRKSNYTSLCVPVAIGRGRFDREIYEAQRFSSSEGPIVTFWVLSELRDSPEASTRALQLYDEAIRELDARTIA